MRVAALYDIHGNLPLDRWIGGVRVVNAGNVGRIELR